MPDVIYSENCRYYLAQPSGPMSVRLVDGCHSSPKGVVEAAKIYQSIFGDEGPWVMVAVSDVPEDLEVEIDEESAEILREALARYGR